MEEWKLRNNEETRRERIRRVIRNRNPTLTNSRFDTSDIIQETELQLWRQGLDPLTDDTTDVGQALLATIAIGHLSKNLRHHHAGKRNAQKDRPLCDSLSINHLDPANGAESNEVAHQIEAAMLKLNDVQRRVLFLRYYCGATFVEIGNELDLTKQRLKTIFLRAVESVAKSLNDNDGIDE